MPRADVVYDDGVLTITSLVTVPGLMLAGEIGESHYRALERSLEPFAFTNEVHLDLGAVSYCDVACLRALILLATTGKADQTGPLVVLHNLPEFLYTTLRIIGWDRLPGLSMKAGQVT